MYKRQGLEITPSLGQKILYTFNGSVPRSQMDLLNKVQYVRMGDINTINNPSELLLSQDHEGMSGVAIASAIEGIRPFLIETQDVYKRQESIPGQ